MIGLNCTKSTTSQLQPGERREEMDEAEEVKEEYRYVEKLKSELNKATRDRGNDTRYTGKFELLWKKLGSPQDLKVEYEALPSKNPAATFKLTGTMKSSWAAAVKSLFKDSHDRESWVVKFSPVDKQDDPWYDVYEEYDVLKKMHEKDYIRGVVPTPKPIHRSTEDEVEVVGTKFIVMAFIEGVRYQNVFEIPREKRNTVFTSVMKTLASLHEISWTTKNMKEEREFATAQSFWDAEICCWVRNFKGATGRFVRGSNSEPDLDSKPNQESVSPLIDVDSTSDGPDTEDEAQDISEEQQSSDRDCRKSSSSLEMTAFVNKMMESNRPTAGKMGIIHGDVNVSNFIFDQECCVIGVVGWKLGKRNGDPMSDLAYFCMMFSRPEDQGLEYRPLNKLPLLMGNPEQIEETILDEYKSKNSSYAFSKSRFWFAKAICCIRLLAIMKDATNDDFESHKSGWHESGIKEHKHLTMEWLAKAGEDFYRKASLVSDANSILNEKEKKQTV